MYKEVLRSIEGAEIFPIIALILFFAFFVGITIWAYKRDKKTVDEIANLPLEDVSDQAINVKARG